MYLTSSTDKCWLCTHKHGKALNFPSLISQCKPLVFLQAGKHSSNIISKAVTISEALGLLATGLMFWVLNPKHKPHSWLQQSQVLVLKGKVTKCPLNSRYFCTLLTSAFLGKEVSKPLGHELKAGSLLAFCYPQLFSLASGSQENLHELLPFFQLPVNICESGRQNWIEKDIEKNPSVLGHFWKLSIYSNFYISPRGNK